MAPFCDLYFGQPHFLKYILDGPFCKLYFGWPHFITDILNAEGTKDFKDFIYKIFFQNLFLHTVVYNVIFNMTTYL